MNAFEKGKLKDQKLNRKQLVSTPEFKQHLFQLLHNLPVTFQVEVLEQVQESTISMKSSALQFRTMELIRKAFVLITSSKNWEEACIHFPDFTSQERLKTFLSLSFKHGPPEVSETIVMLPLQASMCSQELDLILKTDAAYHLSVLHSIL